MCQQFLKSLTAAVVLALLLFTTGCLADLSHLVISDLERMPQDPLAYLDPATAHQPLITSAQQQVLASEFLERHFAAWHSEKPLASTGSPFWAVDWIKEHEIYGVNLRPVGADQLQQLIDLTAPASYPSLNRRAIAVRRSNLRALPSRAPLFNDPRKAGEGFPFDNLQHSALPANTPLHVTHISKDGSWVFAETSLVYGWMPVNDLAWIDDAFAREFVTGHYLTLTRDSVPLFDSAGIYRFRAGIGTLLPLISTESGKYRVLLAVADRDRRGHLVESMVPLNHGEVFPLPLNAWRLASLAVGMMGQPYTWGESFNGRDCSATVRDTFAPFGLWLPRNSSKQARMGKVIPLSELAPGGREKHLLSEGVPFLTLIRIPGHIMLYIGGYEGRAALLHTIWGLRTRNLWGREGRWLIGKTVITSLEPGLEQAGVFLDISNLRNRVESMNILAPADSHRVHGSLFDYP
ncbi:MAG: SH3 domain-containing protein [Desulfuromonadales bacterium]|nr:SH3 domain-containing protein [Desulfuromonadales bacterium]